MKTNRTLILTTLIAALIVFLSVSPTGATDRGPWDTGPVWMPDGSGGYYIDPDGDGVADVTVDSSGAVTVGSTPPAAGAVRVDGIIAATDDLKFYNDSGVDIRTYEGSGGGYRALAIKASEIILNAGTTLVANVSDAGISLSTGDLMVGTTSIGETAEKAIGIGNGTAPTTYPVVQLWADSGELKAADTSGNVATLTSNVNEFPADMAISTKYPYVSMVDNVYLGQRRYIAEGKMAELVQTLARTAGLLKADEYIIRYEDIAKHDWDAGQQKIYDRQQADVDAATAKRALLAAQIAAEANEGLRTQLTTEYDAVVVPAGYVKRVIPAVLDAAIKAVEVVK